VAAADDPLFAAFRDPPSRYRPFVRWWWNGGCVTGKEILRELDLLKEAGIGGVEINTLAMPEGTDPATLAGPVRLVVPSRRRAPQRAPSTMRLAELAGKRASKAPPAPARSSARTTAFGLASPRR
jgi:hypothetical protein